MEVKSRAIKLLVKLVSGLLYCGTIIVCKSVLDISQIVKSTLSCISVLIKRFEKNNA